ncbi:hypothetical protein DI53_3623 [Sphingobacterium deserti]|uniref:Uncharacterized protein n=2 Tax=Sphingobacterium deserti TaxID=1229276 RepID=A0A0B8T1N3_9SPHI|nr:hypothetical protein DI53_3623 [Sphingobacterium deserti]
MKKMSRLFAFGLAAATLTFGITSCKKDSPEIVRELEIDLPEMTSLHYGKTAELALPASVNSSGDLSLSLAFDKTPNIEIGSNKKLHDVLKDAVQLDLKKQQINIDAALLYPNAAQSMISTNRIPEIYTATLEAKTVNGKTVGERDFQIKVSSGKIAIEHVNTSNSIPFSYALYSDKSVEFKLAAENTALLHETWYIAPSPDQKQVVSIDGSTIRFSADAGDPAKKAEHTYDLKPMLLKDGFVVAETDFRVVFIPQIKFFYGTYYPDLNLTIQLNLIHIGLSNGYLSAAPTLYPENYKSTFHLVSVGLDGTAYDNSRGIFSVNQNTGAVSVKKDDSLKAGSYKIIVKAITTTGLEYQTDLTLVMSAF